MGKLLGFLHTIFGLSYAIIEISTNVATSLVESKDTLKLTKSINNVIKKAKPNEIKMSYVRLPGFKPLAECAQKMELFGLRIFTFSDAGFASLRGERSVEADLVLRGREIRRDGSISCRGTTIDPYARCISRCVRSTMAAESVACANSIEVGLRHRALLTEIPFGIFVDSRPLIIDPFRLNKPFELPVDNALITTDGSVEVETEDDWIIDRDLFALTSECQWYNRQTHEWVSGGAIYQKRESNVKPEGPDAKNLLKRAKYTIQVIALTDSANVYTAEITQQPRTVDKLTNITLSFIRDLASTVHCSFLDANFNHSDAGIKHGGICHPFRLIVEKMVFAISFLGRREVARIQDMLKLSGEMESLAEKEKQTKGGTAASLREIRS